MNYIFTFVWAFILVQMINFVLMSLGGGQDLNLPFASVMGVIVGILAIIIAHIIPNEPVPHHEEH
ncbi:DUF2929 family protein [Macrococcoides canis]|uniref:DUF2929 family protein n=1 Tax=Macrococcoides canis TaxID=1855823 RepID=A0A4R6C5Y8_9STAP|nr:DUF2929 family protein [Macrococcus canis]MEE1106674.1 DUF2929 family protein [Macrococcus canis]TDM17457.1 DUF2929 family protein [Macrococcus canis]TDM20785.1 DUF2929 family protein [Macrococcus canis]TDM24666.1 DUF2929 family protein [Macrococcus canis]TDM32381.1 DUF2929 family protein [Macrococcus canis]